MVNILLVGFAANDLPATVAYDVNFTLCDTSLETTLNAKESILLARRYASNSHAAIVNLTKSIRLDEALLLQMAYNNDVPVYGIGNIAHVESTFLHEIVGRSYDKLAEAVEHITLHFGGK